MTALWHKRRKRTEVSLYRAFTIAKVGRRWKWQHENCDGDNRCGVASSKFEAMDAVDDWYDRARYVVPATKDLRIRAFLKIGTLWLASLVAIWAALAIRTGGF